MRSALRHAPALCLIGAGLGIWTPALAVTRRMAVVIGNNVGGPTDKPLHYAEEDATKVADVLAQLGDVQAEDLFVLKGRGRDDLKRVIEGVAQRATGYRENPEDRTVLVFFYSGHSDGEALELGSDRIPYGELRAWLAATRTDVRIVIVDGCKSGALVQRKGGTRGPPFEIRLTDQLDAAGEAMLTSSAADELALESHEIRGSFFTHHLVSGLRGAADANGDGRITLSEAYQYAFDHTLVATALTGSRQHPGYDYRLAGKGELVLTEVTQPSASVELPEGFERALIVLIRRDQVLAELGSGAARRVALAPGEYAVRLWKGTQAYASRVTLAAGEAKRVSWSDLRTIPSPQVAGKGRTDVAPDVDALEGLTPEAKAEYLEKYFAVGDQLVITVTPHHAKVDTSFQIYRGKYRKKIDEDDFFREVGRPDLAESYVNRRILKWGLVGGGLAIVIGGIALGASKAGCSVSPGDPRFVDLCVNNDSPLIIAATGFVVGGALAAGGAFLVNPHPVEADEIRRLADDYNGALRRKLSSPPGPRSLPGEDLVTFDVIPTASSKGGGLLLRIAF